MFISHQTYEGLQTTVYSFIEVCKFLLQRGVPYVLSERFCQDDLEITLVDNELSAVAMTIHQSEMLVIMATQIKTQFIVTPIMGKCTCWSK